MLSPHRRAVWCVRLSLDERYPVIIGRARAAITSVTGNRTSATHRVGCVEVVSYSKHWPCVLPQHGLGPKHLRPIRLEPWQRTVVAAEPGSFLAGLIHSDGCRCMNRVNGRNYPRYFFTNLSADIRGLFIEACSMVGVDCRPAGTRNISVARRDSVAILDRLVGPKA